MALVRGEKQCLHRSMQTAMQTLAKEAIGARLEKGTERLLPIGQIYMLSNGFCRLEVADN